MATTITIRGVTEEVHAALLKRAERNKRSMTQEVLSILVDATAKGTPPGPLGPTLMQLRVLQILLSKSASQLVIRSIFATRGIRPAEDHDFIALEHLGLIRRYSRQGITHYAITAAGKRALRASVLE